MGWGCLYWEDPWAVPKQGGKCRRPPPALPILRGLRPVPLGPPAPLAWTRGQVPGDHTLAVHPRVKPRSLLLSLGRPQ